MAYEVSNQKNQTVGIGSALAGSAQITTWTTADPVERRAPVDTALNALQDRIGSMERLVASLEARFEPAMRPVQPEPTPATPPPSDFHAASAVGSIIQERCYQIQRLEWRIESLLSRCEL